MNVKFSENDQRYMTQALSEATAAMAHDDVPVGAVLVNQKTGEILAACHNTKERDGMVTGHAELLAIQQANAMQKTWRLSDCTLYVTLEPCPMCAGAIIAARIPRVVYGAKDAVAGAMGSVWALHEHPSQNVTISVESGLMEDDAKKMLREFFKKKREPSTHEER